MWLLFSSIALQPQNCSSSHTHHAVPQPDRVHMCVACLISVPPAFCRNLPNSAEICRNLPNSAEFCRNLPKSACCCILLQLAACGRVWSRVAACVCLLTAARGTGGAGCAYLLAVLVSDCASSARGKFSDFAHHYACFIQDSSLWPRVAACGRVWLLARSAW